MLPAPDIEPVPGVEAGAGVQVLAAEVLCEGGEPLVEPSLAPPLASHQVTKPLKRFSIENCNKWQTDFIRLEMATSIDLTE